MWVLKVISICFYLVLIIGFKHSYAQTTSIGNRLVYSFDLTDYKPLPIVGKISGNEIVLDRFGMLGSFGVGSLIKRTLPKSIVSEFNANYLWGRQYYLDSLALQDEDALFKSCNQFDTKLSLSYGIINKKLFLGLGVQNSLIYFGEL